LTSARVRTSVATVLSGAALATSWTWCIGMYAPFVLYGMFGWPGIVAFAIPNILGCALFGFLRSRERSLQETRDHAHAMVLFSAATIAYQLFFAASQMGPFIEEVPREGAGAMRALAAGGVFAAALALACLPRRVLWLIAGLGFFASLTTFAFLPWGTMNSLHSSGEWTREQLWLVLPTIVFGFMLSPNLDLTFHRGRQDSPNPRFPANFIVFGLGFASMLVLTTSYVASPQGLTIPAVRAHIALQLVLTCALHLSEIRTALVGTSVRVLSGLGAAIIGLAAALLWDSRDTYLAFLGLYGLLFPAYAALALRLGGRPTRASMLVLLVSIGVSSPILWITFIDGPILLAPLAVILPLLAVMLCRPRSAMKLTKHA
jgi:hypothetical protein